MAARLNFIIGQGLAADRPATPDGPADVLQMWWAQDDQELSLYDSDATAWVEDLLDAAGVTAGIIEPQARLTTTTATPVLTADVTGAGTIYHALYKGNRTSLYNGAAWIVTSFTEASQALSDNTKSPAAAVGHSCYDFFQWDDAGTIRCTRGPRWIKQQTFTVTIASPAVFSATGHGLKEGDPVVFTTTGALPTGLTASTVYFVISAGLTADAFEVAATIGGAAINTSGSQSGVHTATDSNRTRGTGAGTTELEVLDGVLVNKNAITNGPGAQRGRYVGTIRTNAAGTVDMIFGGVGAAGGESCNLGIWNMYNRIQVAFKNFDNTDSWNYTTAAYRVKNGNAANRITFVTGVQEECLSALHNVLATNSSANIGKRTGIGLNTTTTVFVGSGGSFAAGGATEAVPLSAALNTQAPLGFNYIAPLEFSTATGTCSWLGDNGGTDLYAIFTATFRA